MKKAFLFIALAIMLTFFFFCARNFTRERYVWIPYNATEYKQTKEKMTIERFELNTLPPDFMIMNRKDPYSGAKLPNIYLAPLTGLIEKISITNNTGNVIRLNTTVFRAFDPAGNQFNIINKAELKAIVYSQLRPDMHPENSYPIIDSKLRSIKLIDRNTELLPNYTTTGYIIFIPDNYRMSGIWKLAIYDLPVATDAAGRPTKTVKFEFRSIAKKYLDVYERGELVQSIEVE